MLTDNARGALLMVAGMASFTLSDAIMKLLSSQLPMFQTLVWRGLGVSLVLVVLAWRKGAFRVAIARGDRWLVLVRTLADTGATWFFLQALYHTPIANLTAIMQALPLTVTLGAALFLGETVGWRRMTAIAVGFLGVLLIVRPEAGGFDRYAVYALVCIGFVTTRDLLTRRMSRSVPSLTIALANAVGVMLFGLAGSATESFVLPSGTAALLLLGTSAFIVGGYVLTVSAVRTGELGFVTPFRYTGLIWALVLGFALFAEWPDTLTQLGAGLVVGTGLFTFYRERASARRARAPIPH
ncbi:DMT family transporter [Pararhodobacter aggregans]|uniref:EamA family transporter n=1 Tax=Pararhodobacter aggregans TaxID=404875 RepID=A0A2T7UNK8_9RHOB|nr:DMT family transporter [Pararhodobacter aggregans]PTX00666.1 S-adenosylmethionine uptake transporter [Pararhodobacter aggregans]PVE46208.1 EamA family transporter [Pararhodobacter aggregans]